MQTLPPENSLRKLPHDPRDFALGAVFPQIDISEVPNDDFVVAQPLLIKDQGDSDLCSAYAITAVSEDQEGEELLPEFQFFRTKQLSGDPDEWGADLRVACKSAVKFGSLSFSKFKQYKGMQRSAVVRSESWPDITQLDAMNHRKETFFTVGGRYDMFDNIRLALWQHRKEKCSVVTGAMFRSEWISAENGIIPKEYTDNGFGHAFKIFGQKVIDGELYLVAQLSQGSMVGDGGLFYFPRVVVNKEIGQYGVYMFKDISREAAEYLINNNMVVGESWISNLWKAFISIFKH